MIIKSAITFHLIFLNFIFVRIAYGSNSNDSFSPNDIGKVNKLKAVFRSEFDTYSKKIRSGI
ncbi:hypothetical protein AH70_01915 [Pediococcus damnosus LMG 28219]|nr:hypothetical protein AH70_01915 [Pediococcus damnosus LMG 28219]PIO80689.1 hypothetical protein BSQ38_03045 [Pediococcus damnosus]PIO85739.1 hypothetical protein BSQ37_07220 [Pediococcus damnosus]PJE49793.1 hypothetical protein BSQ36_07630 [Pediococcus damnosus]